MAGNQGGLSSFSGQTTDTITLVVEMPTRILASVPYDVVTNGASVCTLGVQSFGKDNVTFVSNVTTAASYRWVVAGV